MTLSLRESQAIAGLAELFSDFLPGSGHPSWQGHVSFKTVAEKVGVGEFWQPASKLPMITGLLQRTLEFRRSLFERLILEIVRGAISYRLRQRRPIRPEEIEKANGLLLELGFKFPDLWDPEFMTSLEIDSSQLAKSRVERAIADEKLKATSESRRLVELRELREQFFDLQKTASPQAAGISFEKILNRLFALHGLAPREPFRVVGEQIDGSFDLDHETYLVEAKWMKEPASQEPLLVFRGKIEAKSAYTRGVFISLNGVTNEARHAITQGKQPTFFVVDGYDLSMILADEVGLTEFLRQRRRLLAEEALVVVPFRQLWLGTRGR